MLTKSDHKSGQIIYLPTLYLVFLSFSAHVLSLILQVFDASFLTQPFCPPLHTTIDTKMNHVPGSMATEESATVGRFTTELVTLVIDHSCVGR